MPRLTRVLFPLAILAMWIAPALAADAPPPPDQDAGAWLQALYTAVTAKAWGPVAGIVLIGLVYPLRRFGPSVFKSQFGGLVLSLLISLAGTFGIALAAGAHVTLIFAFEALSTAAIAAGLWEWLKTHIPGVQAAADKATEPVQPAGGS